MRVPTWSAESFGAPRPVLVLAERGHQGLLIFEVRIKMRMTLLDVAYRYGRPPGETEMRSLKDVREVYGIWGISFDELNHKIKVEYDASRLGEDDVAALLRNAGVELVEKIALIPPTQPIAA